MVASTSFVSSLLEQFQITNRTINACTLRHLYYYESLINMKMYDVIVGQKKRTIKTENLMVEMGSEGDGRGEATSKKLARF